MRLGIFISLAYFRVERINAFAFNCDRSTFMKKSESKNLFIYHHGVDRRAYCDGETEAIVLAVGNHLYFHQFAGVGVCCCFCCFY